MKTKSILWLCNRKRCDNCLEDCRHTSDREFAINPDFDRTRFGEDFEGNLWEDPRYDQEKMD